MRHRHRLLRRPARHCDAKSPDVLRLGSLKSAKGQGPSSLVTGLRVLHPPGLRGHHRHPALLLCTAHCLSSACLLRSLSRRPCAQQSCPDTAVVAIVVLHANSTLVFDTPKCGLLRLRCLRCAAPSASSQTTWCNSHIKFGLVCLAIMPENAEAASKQARQALCVSDVGTEIDSEHFYGHDHEAKGPRGLALASQHPAPQSRAKPSRPHLSALLSRSPRCGS